LNPFNKFSNSIFYHFFTIEEKNLHFYEICKERAIRPKGIWDKKIKKTYPEIIEVAKNTPYQGKSLNKCQAIITKEAGVMLGIFAKDCPVWLIYDPVNNIIALVHSGRQQILEMLPKKVIEYLNGKGSSPSNLVAICSPCICPQHYNLTTAEELLKKYPQAENWIQKTDTNYQYHWGCKIEPFPGYSFDLYAASKDQLLSTGLKTKNIVTPDKIVCTYGSKTFHSFRREGEKGESNLIVFMMKQNKKLRFK
jgi:copper oxidase (laccase) domain-containing protein